MTREAIQDYEFYGCRLRSSLPLSLVSAFSTDQEAAADITLKLGHVPETLAATKWSSPFISIGADGLALVQIAGGARMLIHEGREILLDMSAGEARSEFETLLLGAAAGVVLHQRGALPLHGSCVEINGMAIAFCGPCGRGKSTLARTFTQHGATLLSDDISAIAFNGAGTPMVTKGSSGIRLWPDARSVLGRPDEVWSPIREGHLKQVAACRNTVEGARPLAAVIRLALPGHSSPGLRRLHGPSAVTPMSEMVYRAALGRNMGRGEALFRSVMRLAATTPIFELQRPDGLDRLHEARDWIHAALESMN